MSRRIRNTRDAVVVLVFVIAGIMYAQGISVTTVLNIIVIGLVLAALFPLVFYPVVGIFQAIQRLVQKCRLKHIARSNKSFDNMTWEEFEYFVAGWLKQRGYTNIRITEKYDLGVDIIAKKDGITWGVQVKHYRGLVGIGSVRQVVVALKKYKCDRAMVITNSIFSRPAIELAKSQDCILIGGSKL